MKQKYQVEVVKCTFSYIEVTTKNEKGTFYYKIRLNNFDFSIEDIKVKAKGKRKIQSLNDLIQGDSSYRKAVGQERKNYELNHYLNYVELEEINEVIHIAWEQIKPTAIKIQQ